MSLSHPGACPDVTTYKQSSMFRALERGLLPDEFHFIGDCAYPPSNQMLTPFQQIRIKKKTRKKGIHTIFICHNSVSTSNVCLVFP